MIGFVCATIHEARALIEFFKLKKIKNSDGFKIFINDSVILIISGVGKIKSTIATTYLLVNYRDIKTIINIGICGSNQKICKIGELIYVLSVQDYSSNKKLFCNKDIDINLQKLPLITYDTPQNSSGDYLSDMEAFGFFESALRFLDKSNIFILKVVSDFCKPETVTIEFVYKVMMKNMKTLQKSVMAQ